MNPQGVCRMSVFAVPKDKHKVVVRFDSGQTQEGSVFLERGTQDRDVSRKMTEFLDDAVFLPFQREDGTTEFINISHVVSIEADRPDDSGLAFHVRLNVKLILADAPGSGSAITGTLLAEAPLERSRLSDCLNMPSRFITVVTADKLHYVNRSLVKKAVLAAG